MSVFRKFNQNYSQHSPNRSKLITELTVSCCTPEHPIVVFVKQKFSSLQEFLKFTPDQFSIEKTADNLNLVEFFRRLNDILLTDDTNYGKQQRNFVCHSKYFLISKLFARLPMDCTSSDRNRSTKPRYAAISFR